MKIQILHISDLHYSFKKEDDIKIVVNSFFKDLEALKTDYNLSPKIVLFSGDIVQSGENSESSFKRVNEFFIEPLIDKLGTSYDNIFFTPGNHEVDRNKCDEFFENGIRSKLNDLDKIDSFCCKILDSDKRNLKLIESKFDGYDSFINKLNNNNVISSNIFYTSYKLNINNLDLGIVSLNSAWSSSNYFPDYENLYISPKLLEKATTDIEQCDIKILVSHHPVDFMYKWLRDPTNITLLHNVNIVCNGHIHNSDFRYIQPVLGSIYTSTCASLYSGRVKNGYTVLDINVADKKLKTFLRSWYKDRREFDAEIEKTKEGIITYDNFRLNNEEKEELIKFNLQRMALKKNLQISDSFMTPITFNNIQEELKLDEVFIDPIISNTSNYDNRKSDDKKYSIEEILNLKKNIIIFGGKEFGKTTLLHQIKNTILIDDKFSDILPIKIKFSSLPKNNYKSTIRQCILPELDGKCSEKEISNYINESKVILLIDDYNNLNDDSRYKRIVELNKFQDAYPNCRYIFTINERITQIYKEESLQIEKVFNTKNVYLAPLNTSKIRELLKKWNKFDSKISIESMLDQICYYFKQLHLPITPMAVNLLIGVLFRDNTKKNIRNEAYLIENYIEAILDKISYVETDFDFPDKESFLSHLASVMQKNNKTYFESYEFEKEKVKYFEFIGEDIPSDGLINDFFKKGILIKSDHKVLFKLKAWYHFFIAKKMEKDYSYRNEIINSPDYLKYSTSISYYCGLKRNELSLLEEISSRANKKILELINDTNQKLEDIADKISKEKLSVEDNDLDEIIQLYSSNIENEIFEKEEVRDDTKDSKFLSYSQNEDYEELENFDFDELIELVTLTSDIIRNTTEINIDKKSNFLSVNVDHYIYLLWDNLNEFNTMIEKVSTKDLYKIVNNNGNNNQSIPELIETFKKLFSTVLPISIILYMVDHLANPKLKNVVTNIFDDIEVPIKKLFLSMLLLKYDVISSYKYITKFIQSNKSRSIDFIIFILLELFCVENEITKSEFEKIILMLNKIRNKYKVVNKGKIMPFQRDTYISDLQKKVSLKSN